LGLRCVELNAKTHARVVAPHVGPGTSAHLLFLSHTRTIIKS